MAKERPLGFFVHHQGRGHAKRCEAILAGLPDRPVTILSARRDIFGDFDDRVRFIELPDMIGDPSRTGALHDQLTPQTLHCVPMGSHKLRQNAGAIAKFLTEDDPTLFVVDVSAEWAILSRLCSVPAVSIRMHGDRNDVGHLGAYEASAAMLAPFDEQLEQEDYPARLRQRTFYTGGLCTTTAAVPTKEEARRLLDLPQDRHIAVVVSGGGGHGTLYAPLTMAARALPESLWLTIGPMHREGHETEFANLIEAGWVDNPTAYLAAADVVVASAGDNTVHEIARVGRPFLCVPEWRYFNEQVRKAERLDAVGAAHSLPHWPASSAAWQEAVAAAEALDLEVQRSLFDPQAASKAASFLTDLEERLWSGEADGSRLPRSFEFVA
ncbi:MAG: glycosyltransferase [Parvularcula sp.]|jgi:predicted glycosyltransferase|nr:glycosyltransferase [Parvularcula sp.]